MDMLDNAVWHSLHGPHRRFAQGDGRAQRFDPLVAPFSALPDEPSASDWADLATLVGGNGFAVLFRSDIEVPDDWEMRVRFRGMQMVHGEAERSDPTGVADLGIEDLGHRDVPEMVALVERTEPGPFAERTVDLGRYVGVRRDGELVAMAGERLRLPGFVEISAVCTESAYRGQGLANGLVRTLIGSIRAGGDVPILHVVETNTVAIRLYESLGFVLRRPLDGMVLRGPAIVR